MSHYDNTTEDFGPRLPESYGGDYPARGRRSSYPSEDTGVPVSPSSKIRVRRGGKTVPLAADEKATPKAKDRKHRASRPQESEDETDFTKSGLVRFFTDSRTHKFFGLLLIALSVFLLIATVSHIRHGAADQSRAMNQTVAEMADGGQVKNSAGPVGAKISYTIMTEWIGLGVLPLIAYFAVIGLSLLGIHKCRFWSVTFQALLIAITASIVLDLATANVATAFAWGGMHGAFINGYLTAYMGLPGAWLVSALLIGAVLLVYYNEIASFIKSRKAMYDARRERRRQAQQEMERQRAEAEAELARANTDIADTGAEEDNEDSASVSEAFHITGPNETNCISLDDIEDQFPEETHSESGTDEVCHGFSVDDTPADTESDLHADKADMKVSGAEETVGEIPSVQAETVKTAKTTAPDTPLDPEEATLIVEKAEVERAEVTEQPVYDPTAELSRFVKPPVDLLDEGKGNTQDIDAEELEANKQRIIKTLLDFGIPITDIKATIGPTITRFEIVPAEGVRTVSIRRLEEDIARSLAAEGGIRIIAPIPGTDRVGIEVPNRIKHSVPMHLVLTSRKYQECKMALPIAIGTTIDNEVFIRDLASIPHLLVAGATGMGKSVGLNAIITSLIYKRHPAELKFVMIDPKMVEFSLYNKIERHYLAKIEGDEDAIITDPEKVKVTLNSLCIEMDNRYALLKDAYVRSLSEYNEKFVNHRLNPEKGHKFLPYIVVIVDEFADLIMMAGKEIEMPIARIAQKARAVGIHLIIATQRPSTNVITGMIKANFPGRMAFRVAQMVDSKTILDRPGANSLIGKGDMLFSINSMIERVQCAFISTPEVTRICDWIYNQPGYDSAYYLPDYTAETSDSAGQQGSGTARDELFEECARFVVSTGTGSTSSLQRRFSLGYNRAGRIVDQLEAAGIVGAANGGKPRAILVDMVTLEHILSNK